MRQVRSSFYKTEKEDAVFCAIFLLLKYGQIENKKYAIYELKIDAQNSGKSGVTDFTSIIIKITKKVFNNCLLRGKLQFDKKLCMLYNCRR